MNAASQGNLVGQRLGKYDLLALLAVGGTAEIYLARIGGEAGFEKYVVAKCLLDHLADQAEYVNMFLDEARIGAQLDHSNIVQTLELGEHNGRYYMVMEYLAGMSLSTLGKKAVGRVPGGLPIEITLHLASQACAGLHYAHERTTADGRPLNIIHRDVSPQNLVVSFEGILKLVDFGIAKAEVRETHTKSGTIKGKFAYMSPEQCLGHDLDRRTDIFALGTIVHELLTGERLFKRGNTYDTYQAIVNGNVPRPSEVNHQLDPTLDDMVMRALAYNREDRYPTAEAFGEALLQTLHRRGKSVGAGDVSRFFDEHFDEELQIHAARMRELLTEGRATMKDITWNSPDLVSDSASQMPDDVPRPPMDATMDESPSVDDDWSTDVGTVANPTGTRRATSATEIDDGSDDDLEDEDDNQPTRIEANPLLRVQTMHAQENKREREASGAAAVVPAPQGKQSKARVGRKTSLGFQAPTNRPSPIGGRQGQAEEDAPTLAGRAPTGQPLTPAELETLPATPSSRGNYPPVARAAPPEAQPPRPAPSPTTAPAPRAAPPPAQPPRADAFPPVNTPTAFRARSDMLAEGPAGAPSGDLLALASEKHATATAPPWLVAVAFFVSLGVGLAVTVLIRSL